jgi:hypothetical protein
MAFENTLPLSSPKGTGAAPGLVTALATVEKFLASAR